MAERIGVLLMAYGGPDSIAELPGYLADIRDGRPTTPAVLTEITRNYTAIGGRSPIVELTKRQADGIAAALGASNEAEFIVYVGMRHWSPWIEETVGRMIEDGVTRAVSLVLAPHFSGMSIAKYQAKIADGMDMYRGDIAFAHVDSYHDAPGLIDVLADRVRVGIAEWPADRRDTVHVIFSAHSLPSRIVRSGDPYDMQVRDTARLVAARAGIADDRWSWSYQSAGRSPEPWLGPTLPEHLEELAANGVRDVVSVPVGFVCDHVEILYDIDIDAQRVATGLGMRLVRPPAINDDPRFIKQVAAVIRERARREGWI
ncbi:MAG TPA: ferrochelatase [Candidatus Elarobacter sp.]|nr:ferrochelatase [Candidatus Elarobacter sp.]